MTRRLLSIILLFSICGLSHAQVEDTNQEVIVKEALELTGYPEISKYNISYSLVNFRWVLGKAPEELAEMEKDMIETQKAHLDEIIESLNEAFNENKDKFLSVLQWLKSPLSRKMTQLYVEAYSPENIFQTKGCYAYYLQTNPPKKERMTLLQEHFKEGKNRSSYAIPGLGYTLYIFRSASDDELKEYLNFWMSELGKWFDQIISSVIEE